MPIEIKELNIRLDVGGGQVENSARGSTAQDSQSDTATGQESIIAACVEQVMEILREKQER